VGQGVDVQFTQSLNGQPPEAVPPPKPVVGKWTEEFTLQEGLNRLAVRAINQGVPAGHEDEETAEADVWVSYKVAHELPPRITVLRFEPEAKAVQLGGKEVWVVDRPAVRLMAKVEASERGILERADWSAGGAWNPVLPSAPGAVHEKEFPVDLSLTAGQVVTVRLQAKSKHSDLNTAERRVVFYPPLPKVVLNRPASADVFTDKSTLSGTYKAATPDPFKLAFWVTSPEGNVQSFQPEVDRKAGTWKVTLALVPGRNTVEAVVSNPWRGEQVSEVLQLSYWRPELAIQSLPPVVREAVKAVRVGLKKDYALVDKHILRWRLTRSDGGQVTADAALAGQAMRRGKEWQADLSGVQWRRGDYRLLLALQAQAGGPEVASQTVTLHFQPPPPVLTVSHGGKALSTTEQKPLAVSSDKLALQIGVQAPVGQGVDVQFTQSLNGQPPEAVPPPKPVVGKWTQEFTLQEGLNRLAVRAINQGVPAGHEDEEAAEADVWVSYKPPHELPPSITALRLEPEPEVKYERGKELWVVSDPAVRLTGKVEARGILVQASFSLGAAPQPLPLGDGQTFAIKLQLKAGEVVPVQLQAKSKYSDLNTVERSIVYYPPLPAIVLDPQDSEDVFTDKKKLTGTFQTTTQDPFDLCFRVTSEDDKTKSFKPELDLKARTWKVELSLFSGGNNIAALVANKWRSERAIERMVTLRYRRPPQITAFPKEVEAVETNKIRLAITVTGPADRKLTAIKVDGAPVRRFNVDKLQTQGGYWTSEIELPEVDVYDGDRNLDHVSIQAVTDEGESRAAVVRVVHKKLPRLPRARFLRPEADDTARRPEYPVTYRIESARPLERVEIRRGSELLHSADLKNVEREGALYVFQADALLTLTNGANRLELVAYNTDGRSPRAEVVVSYTVPAVLASIDGIELPGQGADPAQMLKPVYRENGEATFPAAPRSLVWLIGHVRWSDPKAKALDEPGLEITAKVGDCRQLPADLLPRGTGDKRNARPFRIPVVLIGPENRITIELPSLVHQDLSSREFRLSCTKWATNQRLHVLIVGVNVDDWVELKKRVLDALVVEPKDRPKGARGEFFKKPPFEQCILHHVLVGDVDRGKVEAQLVAINNDITRLERETGWLNDVVLIYYQGEDVEVPDKNERWLKTSPNFLFPKAPPQRFAISCQDLPRVPGVELLLLNVPRRPDEDAGLAKGERDWGGQPDTGFLRFASKDRTEARKADSALLALLQEAVRKKGRLGEVVNYVNDLVKQQPTKFGDPLIFLDEYQSSRRINEPAR
jgi:hypothetical protein